MHLGSLPEPGSQVVVFGQDPLDTVWGQVVLEVADAPEQLSDPGSLRGDLAECALEFVLGIQCPLPPPRFSGIRLAIRARCWAVTCSRGDQASCLVVMLEDRAGDNRARRATGATVMRARSLRIWRRTWSIRCSICAVAARRASIAAGQDDPREQDRRTAPTRTTSSRSSTGCRKLLDRARKW